ncbi:hypothetical protein LINGRAHAP2_LOCUS9113 [Linum grandiflorum]
MIMLIRRHVKHLQGV